MTTAQTIFAVSSGQPPAAIAIIRISGPAAGATLSALAGRLPRARQASLVTLRNANTELDRALILWFPGPATATGEDLAELHIHGGRAVIAAVLATLADLPDLRLAVPGEFTRRALDNGRIDLVQAEGLADLLAAETESQRINALRLADGHISRAVADWRERLIMLAAELEARIDYADEGDVPDDDGASLIAVTTIIAEMSRLLAIPPAERLRDGIRVVLAGPPNVGKSTLLNALAGREAAITTPIAGTTRDLIEVPVALNGLPFILIDSAGLRDAGDAIESIGIARATAAIASADLVLWLGDPAAAPANALTIASKADYLSPDPAAQLALSAITGEGVAELVDELCARAQALLPGESELALNQRQRAALYDCQAALAEIDGRDILLTAEQLRGARAALDRLTGAGGVEALLDALFGRFCIGK
jgi:tRNA modification GTPase